MRHGVYQLGHGRPTLRGRWMADVLACGDECGLGAETALQLMGVRPVNRRRTTVITSKRGRRAPKGIDLRTSRNVEFIKWDGIPTTPLPRALADAAPQLDDEQLEAALERAVVEHELDLNSIPQRNRRLNQLINHATLAMGLTDSDLENLFRGIIKKSGLPQPKSNQWVWTGSRHYKPDFLWPDHGVIVEIDGWGVHKAQREADTRRFAHLAALGYHGQRFTRLMLIRHTREVVAALHPFLNENRP